MQDQDTTSFILTERQLRNFKKKIKVSDTHSYNGTPCQEWTKNTRRRYGQFKLNRKMQRAHRVAWMIAHGEILDGLHVLHHCDNPPCTEVSHLFLGTHQENMDDREAKGRGNRPRGDRSFARLHPERMPRGDKNGSRTHPERRPRGSVVRLAKLTEEDIPEVFRLRSHGLTQLEIGVVLGVCNSAISHVLRRETWAHVSI